MPTYCRKWSLLMHAIARSCNALPLLASQLLCYASRGKSFSVGEGGLLMQGYLLTMKTYITFVQRVSTPPIMSSASPPLP